MMKIQAPIFDIQRFSIHDGPGIRTLIFFKGCSFHCSWCQNPESQFNQPVLAFYADRCKNSFECLKVCQQRAIMPDNFRVNYDQCSVCGECVPACGYDALVLVGQYLTPVQLFEKIMADCAYYASSNGGITFTGGEPTLYPLFIDRVLDLCIEQNIHTNLETAGSFSFTKWQPILQKLDLIYFDLKILDAEQFHAQIGNGYETVMRNARTLTEKKFPVEYRLPLIPGITDRHSNIDKIAGFLNSMGVKQLHLLDYHNMGEAKIDIIQGNQPRLSLPNYPATARKKVQSRLIENGINTI
jgi:pyruvate formate lyase activating enzyme